MGKISEQMLAATEPALPATLADTATNILKASNGIAPLLKFKKGNYLTGVSEVPIGSEFLAYCPDWVRGYVKFVNNEIVDKRIGRVADGFVPPDRNELDSLDESQWPTGIDGKPADPWQFQHYL